MKIILVLSLLCPNIFATDAPVIEANGSGVVITFPEAAKLMNHINVEGKHFLPPIGNFFAQLGFPPPKDKIGTLWFDAILASFGGQTMSHQEFITQLSRAHRIVYEAIIKETDRRIAFLANGTSALWCQQFYRMTMPEKYWNQSLDFLRLQ